MQSDLFAPAARPPLVVAYGAGVDSTAMLVGFVARGIRPDAILFADVGGEKDETYAYLSVMNGYLEKHGFPTVTTVRYVPKDFKHWPPYASLEENCLTNGTLPSEAFGFGSCSKKWKAAPQKTWLQKWEPAATAWRCGVKVKRAVGFDASPADSKRRCKAEAQPDEADLRLFDYWYPLQDWGWDRQRCIAEIRNAGLPVPQKSSCFYCPNMSPAEIRELPADKLKRIVLMEARAKPRLTKIDGLWRTGCKGTRGSVKKPGRMSDYIRAEGLLPAADVDRIEKDAPAELIARNEAFANGIKVNSWGELLNAL
jgi:hypothetical protein